MACVAVLEDDPDVLAFICDALRARGHEILPFGSFVAARDAILNLTGLDQRLDLFVTDVDLRDGNGLDLVRLLKQVRRDLPVLVQSGYVEEQDLLAGFEAGAADYLTKPVSASELIAKCSVLIARAHAKRQQDPGQGRELPGGLSSAFGRYQITGVLGQGGGGNVYEALDLQAKHLVALKVMPALACLRPGARQRFVREVYTLSAMHHPGVAQVVDFGTQEGRCYYTMELIPGSTLERQVHEQGPLSEESTRRLLLGVAQALVSVHQARIVHRDLKPSNLMLREGDPGRPVIIDFGVAKRGTDHSVTKSGAVVGTPTYFSPEQARGEPLDGRSDIFSLGLVGYFALTGERFYQHEDLLQLVAEIRSRPLKAPRHLSSGMREVLEGMTRIAPEDRVPTAEALVQALKSLRPEEALAWR